MLAKPLVVLLAVFEAELFAYVALDCNVVFVLETSGIVLYWPGMTSLLVWVVGLVDVKTHGCQVWVEHPSPVQSNVI